MRVYRVLFAQFAAALVLSIADIYFGINRSYYYYYWWFDILTHFLGGMWAGLFCIWLLSKRNRPASFWLWLTGVLIIGVGWELFEAGTGLTEFPADTFDTVKDIFVDVAGALSVYFTAAFFGRRSPGDILRK